MCDHFAGMHARSASVSQSYCADVLLRGSRLGATLAVDPRRYRSGKNAIGTAVAVTTTVNSVGRVRAGCVTER